MKKIFLFVLLLSAAASAQVKFEKGNASKNYSARMEVERCEEDTCSGKLKIELFKKSAAKPFQVINIEDTEFDMEEAKLNNAKRRYDYQSIIFFEDYNFDGIEDLSIRDGNNGAYSGPSYQIYLYSPQRGKFVHSEAFTRLAQSEYLGMFEVDKKKRVVRVASKGGCCMHRTEEFRVVKNRLVKVFEIYEEVEFREAKGNRLRIETSRLVKGRRQTRVRYEKIKED
ncbi:MAG TPA: hypothetical protein VF721_13130 [Pyrinomonadaceae bacterium]|jgi:hypothetical protein